MISSYTLSSQCIDDVSEAITTLLRDYNLDPADILRVRLSAEECLGKYLATFGEGLPVSLRCEKSFSEVKVAVSVETVQYNPLLGDDSDDIGLINRLMRDITVTPIWHYRGRSNVITFALHQKKKVPSFLYYILGAVLGIGGGLLAKSLSPSFCRTLADSYLTPVSDVIMGFLTSLASLMIFSSVVSGICSMKDINTFRRVGLKMIVRFLRVTAVCCLFTVGVCLLFAPIGNSASASLDVASLWQTLVDIVPLNVFRAFSSGNVLQIIFISILCGIVSLKLFPKTSYMADWLDNFNMIIQEMLQIAVIPMPLVVFVNLFKLASVGESVDYSDLYKLVVSMAICCAALIVFSAARVCVRQKVAPSVLIKKLLPTFLITISTASSIAAYTTIADTCENRLGIDKSICKTGVPFGQVVYKPSSAIWAICACLCFAQIYGVTISVPRLIILIFTSIILAVALPPIPGVMVCALTLLFTQLGLPLEALAISLALDFIFDRIATATDMVSLQTELTQFSDSMSMLDRDTLRRGA